MKQNQQARQNSATNLKICSLVLHHFSGKIPETLIRFFQK